MSSRLFAGVVALAALAAGAAPGSGQATVPEGPTVTVYRTFQPPEYTVVHGLVRVDPVALGSATCEYGINVRVLDDAGGVLLDRSWENRCPAVDGAYVAGLETFQFALRPAHYTLEVALSPKGEPDKRQLRRQELVAFKAAPLVSDLILAHEVGWTDTAKVSQWTVKRGSVGIRAASEMLVDPADPNIAYYVELYPTSARTLEGHASGVVRRPDGKELASFALPGLEKPGTAQPLAGSVSVAGLPAGSYVLDVQLQLPDTQIVRSHPFQVLEAGSAAVATGYVGTLTDEQLTAKFDAVVVLLANKSDAERYRALTPKGKRQYLAQLFGTEAPVADDGKETQLEIFLSRSEFVNRRFIERAGRANQPGWQTDRGRIWLLHGEPSSQMSRPSPRSGAPYELWYYTQKNRYVYLFADETRMGHYRLIYTNDPDQEGIQDWDRRVGPQVIEDMQQMGIQLPRTGGGAGESEYSRQ